MTTERSMEAGGLQSPAPVLIRIWDPLVRVFHWSLVLLVCVAWLTPDSLKTVHQAAGYLIAALLGLRLVWGFVGTRPARFSDFLHGPRKTLAYIADIRAGRAARHLGHNPAGGAMIVLLMLTIAATIALGHMQTLDRFWGVELLEDLHEAAATAILVLVGLHVLGVIHASLHHRENLVISMIDGLKPGQDRPADQ